MSLNCELRGFLVTLKSSTDMFDLHTHNKAADWRDNAVVNLNTEDDFSPFRRFSLGIHPWEVDESWQQKLQQLKILVDNLIKRKNTSFAAIGEIGIDRLKGGQIDIQIACFEEQLRLAESCAKPVIIHCTRAFDLVLESLKKMRFDGPVVFHGFRGKPELAAQLMTKGYYLSFGTKFNAESLKLAYEEKRMFLETDDSGADIAEVYESAGRVLNISPTDIFVPGIFTL